MKQVIIVNDSLKLPKGKLAAQVAHAAVASSLDAPADLLKQWLQLGMPKIVLKTTDEDSLNDLQTKAALAGLPCRLIRDAGKTVIASGTVTCLGIGPAQSEKIDKITTGLKLL
jgi:peptidyl-tRNA hydrolase, PTH2 family